MMPILAIRRQPAADLLGRVLIKLGLVAAIRPCPLWPTCGPNSGISRGPRSATPLNCYFARFHTKSNVTPAGVRGFVNFISSAVMDVMIRR